MMPSQTINRTECEKEKSWDFYHIQCYDIGGIVIHPINNTAVECRRIGIINPKELK